MIAERVIDKPKLVGVNLQFDKARKSCLSQIKVHFVYLPDATKKIRLGSYWFETAVQCAENNQYHSKEQVKFW